MQLVKLIFSPKKRAFSLESYEVLQVKRLYHTHLLKIHAVHCFKTTLSQYVLMFPMIKNPLHNMDSFFVLRNTRGHTYVNHLCYGCGED